MVEEPEKIHNLLHLDNPAATVSALLRLLDIDVQRSLILDFAKHMMESASKVFTDDISMCNEAINDIMKYQKGDATIESLGKAKFELHMYQSKLSEQPDKRSQCMRDVILMVWATIVIGCGDGLYRAGYIHSKPRLNSLGATAYGIAEAVGKCASLSHPDVATSTDKQYFQESRRSESSWQLQHLLNITDITSG